MMKNLRPPKGGAIAVILILSALLATNYFASHQSKERLSTLIKEFHSELLARNNTHENVSNSR